MYNFNALNNSVQTVKSGLDLKTLPFKKLKDFTGKTLLVEGFFFTKGKYGKQVCVVANGTKINMPQRAVEKFEIIEKDEEALNDVLNGHLIIKDIVEREYEGNIIVDYRFDRI